jgi:hydroxymethylbilane synthase
MPVMITIGSRGSALALAQAEIVRMRLEPLLRAMTIRIVAIHTSGDRMTDASLERAGGKGLFVKELEEALADRRIDLAVHSMKDLPAALSPAFRLAAVPEREDPRDVLVTRDGAALGALTEGAKVGTSSIRRRFQLKRVDPSLKVVALRGNVDTRLKRLAENEIDAIVIALAGLRRLGRAAAFKFVTHLDESNFVPAGGQGALAVEALADGKLGHSSELEHALVAIDDARARYEVTAERAFLASIGASCATPVGVRATASAGALKVRAMLFSADGSRVLDGSVDEPLDADLAPSAAAAAGELLGEHMLARGAREMVGDG